MKLEASDSRLLTAAAVKMLAADVTNLSITRRDLKSGLGHLSGSWREASLKPDNKRSGDDRLLLAQSEAFTTEFERSDVLVAGLPIYNFNLPTAFRAWIDLVCRDNVDGAQATSTPNRAAPSFAIIIVTSNHTKLNTDEDFVSKYLKHIMKFMGVKTTHLIDVTGLAENKPEKLNTAKTDLKAVVAEVASVLASNQTKSAS